MEKKRLDPGENVAVAGMEDLWNVWYSELHDHTCGLTLKIDKLHESTESDFQRIDVIRNKFFGNMLVLYVRSWRRTMTTMLTMK